MSDFPEIPWPFKIPKLGCVGNQKLHELQQGVGTKDPDLELKIHLTRHFHFH